MLIHATRSVHQLGDRAVLLIPATRNHAVLPVLQGGLRGETLVVLVLQADAAEGTKESGHVRPFIEVILL